MLLTIRRIIFLSYHSNFILIQMIKLHILKTNSIQERIDLFILKINKTNAS